MSAPSPATDFPPLLCSLPPLSLFFSFHFFCPLSPSCARGSETTKTKKKKAKASRRGQTDKMQRAYSRSDLCMQSNSLLLLRPFTAAACVCCVSDCSCPRVKRISHRSQLDWRSNAAHIAHVSSWEHEVLSGKHGCALCLQAIAVRQRRKRRPCPVSALPRGLSLPFSLQVLSDYT